MVCLVGSPVPGQGKAVVEGEGASLPLSGLSGRERGAGCMATFPTRAEVTDSDSGKMMVVGIPGTGQGKMLETVGGAPEWAREQG